MSYEGEKRVRESVLHQLVSIARTLTVDLKNGVGSAYFRRGFW